MKIRPRLLHSASIAAATLTPACASLAQEPLPDTAPPTAAPVIVADVPAQAATTPASPTPDAAPAGEAANTTPPAPKPREWFGENALPWTEWSRATGDWGGVRSDLEDAGFTIAGSFTFNWSSVLSGGLERRAFSRRFLDINATLDLAKLAGWDGGSVFVDFMHYSGELGNPVGDALGTDGLATSRSVDQIAELWFQQKLFDDMLRLKFGKIDANSEFAVINVAGNFVTTNGVWDANLLAQPTYPEPSTGLVAFVYPTKNFYAGFGFFDGAAQDGIRVGARGPATFFSDSKSDNWYFTGELGFMWEECCGLYAGRIGAGGWGATGDFARFDGGTENGTQGGYFLGEQQLTRDGDSDELKTKGLYCFARCAFADKAVSVIGLKATGGLVLKGTFCGREADECGLMYSFADLSRDSGATHDEHNIEAYYKLQLFGSLSITPDIQYIANPSGVDGRDDAWLGTLSFTVSF